MRAHIARGREARTQISLRVLHRDQQRLVGALGRGTLVEHVGMCVNQARQDGGLAEIDHLHACWNLDRAFRADVSDPLTGHEHDTARHHLTARAVEQASGTNRDGSSSGRAFVHPAIGSHAWRRPCAAPRSRRRLHLCRRGRSKDDADGRRERKDAFHWRSPVSITSAR